MKLPSANKCHCPFLKGVLFQMNYTKILPGPSEVSVTESHP